MKHVALTDFQNPLNRLLPLGRAIPTLPVLGQPLTNATSEEAVQALLSPGRRRVFFMNAHCYNLRARDSAYAEAVARAEMVLPDGIGVELAARMTGASLTANLNGTDLVPDVLASAARRNHSVFLYGARPGVAEEAAERLCKEMPGLRIVGTQHGYDADDNATIAAINASKADIVLVAMGVPAQEIWLDRNAHRLDARLTFGVGALFDFLAGRVQRAPEPMRRAKLEWAWRLAMEPRRMAKRYLLGNLSFMARAAGHALRLKLARIRPEYAVKRGLDLAVAGGALLVTAPFLAMIMLAIRVDSRGGAFFRQTRIGKDGTPFGVYKFRSMHVDAEARRAALLASSDRAGVCFKARNDPRVTRVGRLLRRFSIDELPQILNVVRGEMSIVGPRPALPEEVVAYPARALARLAVKPGITGVWQVSGRADIGFDKMIDMDLAYARSASPLLDLVLIALTFRAVFSGRGAY